MFLSNLWHIYEKKMEIFFSILLVNYINKMSLKYNLKTFFLKVYKAYKTCPCICKVSQGFPGKCLCISINTPCNVSNQYPNNEFLL